MRPRVIVIGAGLAGLTAARYLERAGAEVTIVDARDRIGGRVWTMREGFADGQHGELGGELIEAEQADVLALAKALDLHPVRILRRGWGLRTRAAGTQRAATTFEEAAKRLTPEIQAFKAAGRRWDSAVARQLARRSASGWLREIRADAPFAAGVTALRNFYLADPDDLSLLMLVEQFAAGEAPGASAMYRLREGNDALAAALARPLRGRMHLESPVARIAQRGGRVRVRVDSRPRSELNAHFVVCTAPATTVRRIEFDPPYPRSRGRRSGRCATGRRRRSCCSSSGGSGRDSFAARRTPATAPPARCGTPTRSRLARPACSHCSPAVMRPANSAP